MVLFMNLEKRNMLAMEKEQQKINEILEENPNYESEMNSKIEAIIDSAILNTPNKSESRILAKSERKIKKLGLRLSRDKLLVMIANQLEDYRMLEEAEENENLANAYALLHENEDKDKDS